MTPLYFLALAAASGAASVWGFRREYANDWAGALGLLGVWVAFVAGSISVVTWVGDMRADRIAALEQRYDITIEEASFGQKPEPWRINGKWYTCYMAEAATEGEPRDLMCATPSADFKTADRL